MFTERHMNSTREYTLHVPLNLHGKQKPGQSHTLYLQYVQHLLGDTDGMVQPNNICFFGPRLLLLEKSCPLCSWWMIMISIMMKASQKHPKKQTNLLESNNLQCSNHLNKHMPLPFENLQLPAIQHYTRSILACTNCIYSWMAYIFQNGPPLFILSHLIPTILVSRYVGC